MSMSTTEGENEMHKYCVEIMMRSYKNGGRVQFEAADDADAFKKGWSIAQQHFGCIAFSVSKKVGRKKVYV